MRIIINCFFLKYFHSPFSYCLLSPILFSSTLYPYGVKSWTKCASRRVIFSSRQLVVLSSHLVVSSSHLVVSLCHYSSCRLSTRQLVMSPFNSSTRQLVMSPFNSSTRQLVVSPFNSSCNDLVHCSWKKRGPKGPGYYN